MSERTERSAANIDGRNGYAPNRVTITFETDPQVGAPFSGDLDNAPGPDIVRLPDATGVTLFRKTWPNGKGLPRVGREPHDAAGTLLPAHEWAVLSRLRRRTPPTRRAVESRNRGTRLVGAHFRKEAER